MAGLLKVCTLQVEYVEPDGRRIHAVNGVDLEVRQGEAVGVLGESGSGKSTIAKAILRLLPNQARITGGGIEFEGQDLASLSERELGTIRGARMAMIPQEPGLALNPVMKVGDQIAEVLRAHRRGWAGKQRREHADALLERVQLRGNRRRMYDAYPHQLSGGQQQRVAIAQAIACGPALVIADEPTASLDSETEAEILRLLRELRAELGMSVLLITHDPQIVEGWADRVAVMYAGRVVEDGPAERVRRAPRHPYTKALLSCSLPAQQASGRRLTTIEGSPPDPELIEAGCSFAPRCRERLERCASQAPGAVAMEDAGRVECFLYGG